MSIDTQNLSPYAHLVSTFEVTEPPAYWRGTADAWTKIDAETKWDHYERRFAAQVIENIKYFRKQQKLTARDLSERLKLAGWPLSVSSINGMLGAKKRKSISVTELLAVALALGVPPIALVVPMYHHGEIETFMGKPMASVDFYKAFTGTVIHSVVREDSHPEPGMISNVLTLLIDYLGIESRLRNELGALGHALAKPENYSLPTSVLETRRVEIANLALEVRHGREYLRGFDVELPALERELAWVVDLDPNEVTLAAIEEMYWKYWVREDDVAMKIPHFGSHTALPTFGN